MPTLYETQTVTATSPSDTTAAAAATRFSGLKRFDWFTIDAALEGATGGTLDVYLQRKVGSDWVDWLHFAQLAAGAAAVRYTIDSKETETAPVTVGANSSPALAAGKLACAHPGDDVRVWFVPGAGTSDGTSQAISITGWHGRD